MSQIDGRGRDSIVTVPVRSVTPKAWFFLNRWRRESSISEEQDESFLLDSMVIERAVLEISPAMMIRDGGEEEAAERIAEGRKERVAANAASRMAISSSLMISIGISGTW